MTAMRALLLLGVAVWALAAGDACAAATRLEAGAPLTRATLGSMVAPALAEAGISGEPAVTLLHPPLPLGNPSPSPVTLELTGLSLDRATGGFSAALLVTDGVGNTASMPVRGRYDRLVDVPVAARVLAAGSAIAAEDLEWQRWPASRVTPDMATDQMALLGAETRRRLVPGRAIRQGDVGPARLVHRGDRVRLVFARGGIELYAVGRALDPGSRGETVRVVNVDSNRPLEGSVSAPGEVRVGEIGDAP